MAEWIQLGLAALAAMVAAAGVLWANNRWWRDRSDKQFEAIWTEHHKQGQTLRTELEAQRREFQGAVNRIETVFEDAMRRVVQDLNAHRVHVAEAFVSKFDQEKVLDRLDKRLEGIGSDLAALRAAVMKQASP